MAQHVNRKHIPTPENQSGAIILLASMKKVMGGNCGEKLDLGLTHKQKGVLTVEYKGTKEDFPIEVEFEGKIVDVKCVVIMSVKVKKGKLEVQYAVSEAGKLQLAKRSSKAKGGGGSKGGGSKGSKGGKGKSKNREVKMTIQPKSICQIAIADVVAETIACLKKSGVALPEGKALEDVKSKLESAILPSMLTFQNVIYSEGANSTRGVAPDYNLFDKKG